MGDAKIMLVNEQSIREKLQEDFSHLTNLPNLETSKNIDKELKFFIEEIGDVIYDLFKWGKKDTTINLDSMTILFVQISLIG